MTRLLSRIVVSALAGTALAAGLVAVPATTAGAATATAVASTWKPRPAQYAGAVTQADVPVTMSDGTVLRADVVRPAGADGKPVVTRLPVIVTITAYNKTVLASGGGAVLSGGDAAYLVERGYVQVTVDARGTGSSNGQWAAFSSRENKDAAEIMTWAASQPWSNGRTGMSGPSYMGISQIFAAAGRPPGLKAIFPQVPAADVYRDVVASGGQLDAGFIPLWMGLVTGTGLIPPAVNQDEPLSGLGVLVDHLTGAGTFTLPLLLQAFGGGDAAFDGPFYAERSPINVIDEVDVPTFLVSGEYDLFQRGTPLLFERLRKRGVPTKMIVGPWDHLEASSGADIGDAGYGSLNELQLRWFDRYVKGRADATLDRDIAPLTSYEIGSGVWRRSSDWIGGKHRAKTFKLSGNAANGTPGALTTGTPTSGKATVLPVPVAGLCTRSASQWTAGLPNAIPPGNPCLRDNAANDRLGVVFETPPMTTPLRIQGPINARLRTSTLSGDGMLSVAVEDVAPDGTVDRLTGGWQVVSHRALDTSRTRYLDGKIIQPYHPFTRAARAPLPAGQVAPVDVEVFPTAAVIKPGHRLRVAVQAFDVPHLLPALPDLLGTLLPLTLHTSAAAPSELTVPVLP